MSMTLRNDYCPIGKDCPALNRADDGGLEMIGDRVDDPTLPPHEAKIRWPGPVARRMAPELVGLDIPDFGAYLEATRRTPGDLLRVQTLTSYGVPSDDQDFLGYVNGAPEPVSRYREPWFQELRDDTAAGRVWRNLHVVRTPLTPYLRYAFEWGYADNIRAGQVVRILDVNDHPAGEALFPAGDFWIIDGQDVVLCRYDDQGRPQGTVSVGASATSGYVALAEMVWRLAAPFDRWWDANRHEHRDVASAV